MANLTTLFKRAKRQLSGTSLRQTRTQEVLRLRSVQGIAWRTPANPKVLYLYPPMLGRHAFCDGPFFVIRNSESECRYRDPEGKLEEQWSYVGCSDCSALADDLVWGWIQDAYQYLKRDKRMKHN